MQELLAGLEQCTFFVYLDVIPVMSHSFEEHVRLSAAGLWLKPQKCSLLRHEVRFLGQIISSKGLWLDSAEVEKVQCYIPNTH